MQNMAGNTHVSASTEPFFFAVDFIRAQKRIKLFLYSELDSQSIKCA
jgi:hypothetical protein